MTKEEKHDCEHCTYGIHLIEEDRWWCDLYGVYRCQVKKECSRNLITVLKRRKRLKNDNNKR